MFASHKNKILLFKSSKESSCSVTSNRATFFPVSSYYSFISLSFYFYRSRSSPRFERSVHQVGVRSTEGSQHRVAEEESSVQQQDMGCKKFPGETEREGSQEGLCQDDVSLVDIPHVAFCQFIVCVAVISEILNNNFTRISSTYFS